MCKEGLLQERRMPWWARHQMCFDDLGTLAPGGWWMMMDDEVMLSYDWLSQPCFFWNESTMTGITWGWEWHCLYCRSHQWRALVRTQVGKLPLESWGKAFWGAKDVTKCWQPCTVHSLKLTFSPLKMAGWKTIRLSYWVSVTFQGTFVSFPGSKPNTFPHSSCRWGLGR